MLLNIRAQKITRMIRFIGAAPFILLSHVHTSGRYCTKVPLYPDCNGAIATHFRSVNPAVVVVDFKKMAERVGFNLSLPPVGDPSATVGILLVISNDFPLNEKPQPERLSKEGKYPPASSK